MMRIILKTLITVIMILFPFWGSALISKFTPYTEGNSITNYVTAYGCVSIVTALILFFTTSRFKAGFTKPITTGILLFFFGVVMLGIAGLVAGPDLTIKMLAHPEREHLRYIILSFGVFLFALLYIHLIRNNPLQLKTFSKWIMFTLFLIATVELAWEFHHHYNYPEGLKVWLKNGNKAEDFGKNYDNDSVGTIAAFGRFSIYTITLWLSIGLYKARKINLWNPIITSFFCGLGIIASVVMLLHFSFKIETPKELGFLIILFIPGIPFLILYWIGIALLTRKLLSNDKNENHFHPEFKEESGS